MNGNYDHFQLQSITSYKENNFLILLESESKYYIWPDYIFEDRLQIASDLPVNWPANMKDIWSCVGQHLDDTKTHIYGIYIMHCNFAEECMLFIGSAREYLIDMKNAAAHCMVNPRTKHSFTIINSWEFEGFVISEG